MERITIPDDEADWCNCISRIKALFFWHRNHGMARREPHPMGKDVDALWAAWKAAHGLPP